jgi:hypothetical protein
MVDDNVEGAVAGSRVHFHIWKVWLCPKKKKKKEAKNRGWLMTNVGCLVSGSRVHFQIWKVWLCKNEKYLGRFPYLEVYPRPLNDAFLQMMTTIASHA